MVVLIGCIVATINAVIIIACYHKLMKKSYVLCEEYSKDI